jgi:biopolymer transport protein ExbB/TolQ
MPPHIAAMFASRKNAKQLLFSSEEAKDVIEWLEDRFYNQKSYINFFISTALMIGLLGTFAGLLVSIDDMGTIILSLSGDIDLAKVISDFAGPRGGMAVGF